MHPILHGILYNQTPIRALEESDAVGELAVLMPEIAALKGRIQPPQYHPEGDAFVHTGLVVERAVKLGGNWMEVWGALVHDLGKAVTPTDELPHHYNHEALGVPLVRTLGERLGVPEEWIVFGQLCAKEHLNIHKFTELRPVKKVDLIRRLDKYLGGVTFVAQADAQGRGPTFIDKPYPQRAAMIEAANIVWNTEEQTHDFAKQFWEGLKDKPEGWFDQQVRMACAKAIQGKFGK